MTDTWFFFSRLDGATVRPTAASLTGAAEALLPQTNQHVEAQVAVGRFVEVLEPPHVLPVVLHMLRQKKTNKKLIKNQHQHNDNKTFTTSACLQKVFKVQNTLLQSIFSCSGLINTSI